ncbi:MAG: hypothetical protein ACQEXV_16200 [Bacillota bacterium]
MLHGEELEAVGAYAEHDDVYMQECLDNLASKGILIMEHGTGNLRNGSNV